MNNRNIYLFASVCISFLTTCEAPISESAAASLLPFSTEEVVPKTAASPAARRHLSSAVLFPENPDTMPFVSFDPSMMQALFEQAAYLRRPEVKERAASGITKNEMSFTVDRLQKLQLYQPQVMLESFDFYRINTDLKSDRVRITGYYTPVIKASRERTGEFQVPLLRRPEANVPPPAAIWGGALAGRNFELAWVRSEKELRNAQLQGSCLVEYPDGKREHFGFGGSVKGSGGAYVFFSRVGDQVLGSGSFPVTAGYSVAVDPRYIPIGSTLLAELPDLDASGKLKGYTYRIVFAQDRGGAILTTKRIDLYCGVGQKGLHEARKINGHGRLWLMLLK